MAAQQFRREASTFGGQNPPGQAFSFKALQALEHPGVGAMQRQPGLTIASNGLLANSIQSIGELGF